MPASDSRGRRALRAATAAALVLCLAALAVRPLVERVVRARIVSAAARRGLTARIDALHLGLWPPLELTGVGLDLGHGMRLRADAVEASWPGRTRLVVRHAVLEGPAGVTIASAATTWEIAGLLRDDVRLVLVRPQDGLVVERTVGPHGSRWVVEAQDLSIGSLLDVRRHDRPLLDGGTVRGSIKLESSAEIVRFDVDVAARYARLPALRDEGAGEQPGDPTDLGLVVAGAWRPAAGALDIPRWDATIAGAAVSGSLALSDLDGDPGLDLSLDVERLDFARLLRASGLAVPDSLGVAPAPDGAGDLGSAAIAARARGRLSDPASFTVNQDVRFTPPQRFPPAIERLRGDFPHEVGAGAGAGRRIDVSPGSPDFIALSEVPPLFVRALLLAEDAGFYGHHGIDLREVPAAVATDWARGGAARGASTITQQLAKNLFLSREKHLGRKLQELAVTFLLESALGKNRILEIYLNIIEWGPDLYGLRPAARTYFGREPAELTPAQMAFLVVLIPGPLKYQSSFRHGTPGPGLRTLIDDLLAKLRSVDALGEDEYARALNEEIVVLGRDPRAAESGAP